MLKNNKSAEIKEHDLYWSLLLSVLDQYQQNVHNKLNLFPMERCYTFTFTKRNKEKKKTKEYQQQKFMSEK